MRADLDRHGVLVAIEAPTDAPTTLALVDVDPAGVPGYHFYLAGASAAAVGPSEAVPPAGTGTEQLVAELPGGVTVMLDPNCPAASRSCSTRTADLARSPPGRPTWTGSAACCVGRT
jgi:hypothetical protein